jgi:hypothetical protein
LAFGIKATSDNLKRIEAAEKAVKGILDIKVSHNVRVRHMTNNGARVELDPDLLGKTDQMEVVAMEVSKLGYSTVSFKPFISGSLAKRIDS